jgi:hypothetical protein
MNKIKGNKLYSGGTRDAKLEPIIALIKEKTAELEELYILKDKLTPFHERLDPESTFYKHYM